MGEFVLRRTLSPGGSRLGKRACMFARRVLARKRDRYVRYTLDGSEMLLPLAHDLPLFRAHYPQYSSNVGRLCAAMTKKYPELTLIDIGANVGDTVAIVRAQVNCPILCVEADEYYFALLQHNVASRGFKDVELVKTFVASEAGEMKGELVSGGGTAHFEQGSAAGMRTQRLSALAAEHARFAAAKVVKIDTDGFDCSIMAAELDWLAAKRPMVFFEYDPYFFRTQPYDGTRIFADMSRIGYRAAIFYDNRGDYLATVDIVRDTAVLEDMQKYFEGRGSALYADVALFHGDDQDVADAARAVEAEWSLQHRGK
jgi:FkbM family methyltransferase